MGTEDNQLNLPQDIYENHLTSINGKKFTRREIDVIACIISGRAPKTIASFLSIGPRTVETHTRNIMLKLECNSRESIRDFIEKSDKFISVKRYYSSLLIQDVFERELKKVSILVNKKDFTCLLMCWREQQDKTILIYLLERHLKLSGVKNVEKHKSSALDLQQIDSTLCIVTEEGIKQFHTDDKAKVEISQLVQKASKNPNSIIFLLLNKEDTTEIPKELIDVGYIDFRAQENYYLAVFEILKKILPDINLEKIIAEFKRQYGTINDPSGQVAPLVHSKTKELLWGEKVTNLFSGIFNGKSKFIIAGVVCLSIFCICVLRLNTNRIEGDSNLQETQSIRSDLIIPTTLLERPELISRIEKKLKEQQGIRTVALLGIVGIGGAGKTTLARSFGRYQKSLIAWEINAETKGSLINSFKDLAYALAKTKEQKSEMDFIQKIRNPEERAAQILYFIKTCLKRHPNWLLIFDNVGSFSDIKAYFPQDSNVWGEGKVIITTRDNNIKNTSYIKLENVIEMGELNKDEALNLFSKVLYNCEVAYLPAEKKVKALAFLENIPPFPLDINVAAYYIKNANITFEQYLERIKECSKSFENEQEGLLAEVSDYTKTRYGIITSSLEKVVNLDPLFGDLLLFICLLDSQNIPKSLLDFYRNSTVVERFVHQLRRYSLLTYESRIVNGNEIPTFSLHRSTQAIVKTYLLKLTNKAQQQKILDRLVKTLVNYCEAASKKKFLETILLLSHLEAFKKNLDLLAVDKTVKKAYEIDLTYLVGYVHFDFLNNLFYAKKCFLEILQKDAPFQHLPKIKLATLLKDLASISVILGDCDQAITFCNQSLELLKTISNSALLIAENYKIMGYAYTHKNDFVNAKHYLEMALTQIASLEPEVKKELEAKIYVSLGILYSCTFMNGERALLGEQYALKALKVLGGSQLFYKQEKKTKANISPYIAVVRRILGDIYCRLGEFEKADTHGYQETQYIIDRSLDDDPHHLLKIELDFCKAEVLIREKKFGEAEKKLTQSIEKSEKMLGINNTWIALPAKIYRAEARIRQEKLDKAYEDCSDVIEKMDNKSQTNYSILTYLTCFYHAAIIKYRQLDFGQSLNHFRFFFKGMKPLCKSLLEEKLFRELESKGVFEEIPVQEKEVINTADQCLQRSIDIFVAIYGASNLFVKDYVLLNKIASLNLEE